MTVEASQWMEHACSAAVDGEGRCQTIDHGSFVLVVGHKLRLVSPPYLGRARAGLHVHGK